MHIIEINTKKRIEFIDITGDVAQAIRGDLKEGVCIIFCPHTTAALTINENADPSVRKDILSHLEKLIPYKAGYSHLEGNADAHIKASLLGSSLTIIVESGRLVLGRWQGIYFCEFDGPRTRRVHIKVIKEK